MTVYATNNVAMVAALENAATGLDAVTGTGTLGITIIDTPSGATFLARSATGIVEAPTGSGVYLWTGTSPTTTGEYTIIWDTGGGTPVYSEERLLVATNNSAVGAVAAGASIESSAELTSGLTGTVGVRILDSAGVLSVARATTGIAETPASSGLYHWAGTAGSTLGFYWIVWDDGSVTPTHVKATPLRIGIPTAIVLGSTSGLSYSDLYRRVNRWTDTTDTALAKVSVNHAYRDLVRRTKTTVAEITFALTAGQATYSVQTDLALADVLAIDFLSYATSGSTQTDPLSPVSMERVRQTRSTLSTGFVRTWTMRDIDHIELQPAPQTTGDIITIDYVQAPPALSADSDYPVSIPDEFHIVIAYGGAMRMAEEEDPGLAETFRQKYLAGAAELKAWVRERTGKTPRQARVGYPDRYPQTPHDRSTYYGGGW